MTEKVCYICLDSLGDQGVASFQQCGHLIHTVCLCMAVSSGQNTCGLCRKIIFEIVNPNLAVVSQPNTRLVQGPNTRLAQSTLVSRYTLDVQSPSRQTQGSQNQSIRRTQGSSTQNPGTRRTQHSSLYVSRHPMNMDSDSD